MRIVAVIPVKRVSERVPSKNFRPFFEDESLFSILLNKLSKVDDLAEIYVSTDNDNIIPLMSDKKTTYLPRSAHYCNNVTPWSEVIHHVVESLPEPDNTHIMWCHATLPLFDRYNEALNHYTNTWGKNDINGLVAVGEFTEFIVSAERKRPVNYDWGVWHPYSQNLEKLYTITGAFFIAQKIAMLNARYVVSSNPDFFVTNQLEALDIDDDLDFELARLIYENLSRFR